MDGRSIKRQGQGDSDSLGGAEPGFEPSSPGRGQLPVACQPLIRTPSGSVDQQHQWLRVAMTNRETHIHDLEADIQIEEDDPVSSLPSSSQVTYFPRNK